MIMRKAIVRIGEKFGRLKIIDEYKADGSNYRTVVCVCDCGNTKKLSKYKVTSGETKSCGCLAKESAREALAKTRKDMVLSSESRSRMGGSGRFKPVHGMRNTSIYAVWSSMISRCKLPSCPSHKSHGGRGIKVCSRWGKFENFYLDMGDKPAPNYSIDRIDNDGDYTPENCRWATAKEQQNNKRNSVFFEFNGKSMTIAQWSDSTGIRSDTLAKRIKNGWPLDKAFTLPVRKQNKG